MSLRQQRHYWSLAFAISGFFVISSLYISGRRQLWFDEILTALISRLPSVGVMWHALSEIEDQTPPLYFLIARASDQVFHHADFGLRFPSALALGVGLLFTFDTARRLTDGWYGLIGMLLVATPFVTYYGHEARSYALFFMLASIVLWLWVSTRPESKLAAAACGVVFFMGVGIHYYFVLCLLPYGIAGLAQRRIFHAKVMAATAGTIVSLAVLYPQIARGRAFAGTISSVWAPSVDDLISAYQELFPQTVLLSALVVIGLALFGPTRQRPTMTISEGERASWFFVTVPLAAYFLGHLVTHVFHTRYIIGAAPGLAAGATCLLWRCCGRSSHLSAALLVAIGGHAVIQQVLTLRSIDHIRSDSGDYQARTRKVLEIENVLLRENKQHLLFPWDIQYLETWYYSKNRDRYECLTAEDRWTIKKYVPLKFVSVEDIVANASQTAIVESNMFPADRPIQALARTGFDPETRLRDPEYRVIYLRSRLPTTSP